MAKKSSIDKHSTVLSDSPNSKSTSLHFWTTGQSMTDLVRDIWVSNLPKKALSMCTEAIGMPLDLAILLVTGKKKLTGDTRNGDGTLGIKNDKTTSYHGIDLSLNSMAQRLEKSYIETLESINLLNQEKPRHIEDEEWQEFLETREQSISYKIKLLAELEEQISALPPIDGKKLSTYSFIVRTAKQIIRQEKLNSRPCDPFQLGGYGGCYFIVHTPVEKCKELNLGSGWLLPCGTFFGGKTAWVHRSILGGLDEYLFFDDKNYSADEDLIEEMGNWIKVSNQDWFIWDHKHKPTREQIEFIILYTKTVSDSNHFNLNGGSKRIHVKALATLLNEEPFDSYELQRLSEEIEENESK